MAFTTRQRSQLNQVRNPQDRRRLAALYSQQNARSTVVLSNRPAFNVSTTRRNGRRNRRSATNRGNNRLSVTVPRRMNNLNQTSSTRIVQAPSVLGVNRFNQQTDGPVIGRTLIMFNAQPSVQYQIGSTLIQPGFFSWLGKISTCYDQYKWLKLQVRYVPLCGSNVNGQLFFGFMYDASTEVTLPASIQDAQGLDKFTMVSPWVTSEWITVAPKYLTDKWYDAQGASPDNHNNTPVALVTGTANFQTSAPAPVGYFEINFVIKFGRPTWSGGQKETTPQQREVSTPFEEVEA